MDSFLGRIERLGRWVIESISAFGQVWLFLFKVIASAFTQPFRFGLLMQQMYAIGWQSVSVVGLVGGFTGAVLAVQGEYTLSKFGATAFTGSAIALSTAALADAPECGCTFA